MRLENKQLPHPLQLNLHGDSSWRNPDATELEVRGEPRNRYPDLTILREEHIQQLATRNTIRLSMLPPLLVIEVVSPGELQRNRDFIAKRSQYQDCGIPEY